MISSLYIKNTEIVERILDDLCSILREAILNKNKVISNCITLFFADLVNINFMNGLSVIAMLNEFLNMAESTESHFLFII